MIETIRSRLLEMQDLEYRDFHKKLIPNIDENTIIGIRTPKLRAYAKEVLKEVNSDQVAMAGLHNFLEDLPHRYYEENNLHAFLLEGIKDFEECVELVDKFLPYVDNWATCDSMAPKVFKKNTDKLLPYIYKWVADEYTYTIRFGIGMLMKYFLDNLFKTEYLELVAGVKSEEYYVNMMIAWYFATAFAKQYEASIIFIEDRRLPVWVHNKAIQKAVESYRITSEQKEYLKSLKFKNASAFLMRESSSMR